MAPRSSSSSSPSSSSKSPPLPPLYPSPLFTPIRECQEDEQGEEHGHHNVLRISQKATSVTMTTNLTPQRREPTPPHHRSSRGKLSVPSKKPYGPDAEESGGGTLVSCNNCRPHARDKISIVPLDNLNCRRPSPVPSPNGILKSIVSTLTGKSPRIDDASPSSSAAAVVGEDRWKAAVAELSHKLIQVSRRRDEAITEASRLKNSVSELEKKLDRLEYYCRNLKADFDQCSAGVPANHRTPVSIPTWFTVGNSNDMVIERFLVAVAEARSTMRILSRSLTVQLRSTGAGAKVYERLLLILKPYEVKAVSLMRNPKGLVCYLEALLNRAFFEDFEATGFQKSGTTLLLNPMERCAANLEMFRLLDGLTWEEVLSKGTRHFSEEFSGFCDRKMSDIIGTLGWNRAWPEPLLQAFFGASKSTWLVHLLANSVHPSLPIFRVEAGSPFDPVYMEDVTADRARRLVPGTVRAMVAPGFYVYGSVVKCKVLCRYTTNNVNNASVANEEIKTTPSPSP
ncbi:hypothetical protein MLD38_038477 [Melastoma candidum]|uniref:Uncharacterized protein n=1 Tax=Melastoma candidum TaxID=119954 RepID=A0ACB9L085_9MYRT|nr:hypothetical protein MLD38_038477 [Melastoma candidum]